MNKNLDFGKIFSKLRTKPGLLSRKHENKVPKLAILKINKNQTSEE